MTHEMISIHCRFIFLLIIPIFCLHSCVAQFVWHLNQSFSLNTSAGMSLDETQPDLVFFPFEPEYSDLLRQHNNGTVFTYLCFISFPPTPHNNTRSYTLAICLDSYQPNYGGQPFRAAAVVWTANRGKPVIGEVMSLVLQSDGNLVLRASINQEIAWSSGTSKKFDGVIGMDLSLSQHTGVNLILFDSQNKSVWQSIDYPADTLAGRQGLARINDHNRKLVSWASPTDTAYGLYSLVVEPEGLALYASFPAPILYWMWMLDGLNCTDTQSSLTNVSCVPGGGLIGIHVDGLGVYCIFQNTGGGSVPFICLNFASTGSDDLTDETFLKVYWDGNLRAHTLQYSAPQVTQRITLMDVFSQRQCDLPLRCGPYGICRGTTSPQCECLTNSTLFHPLHSSDGTQLGCVPAYPLVSNCTNDSITALSNKSTSTSSVSPEIMHRVEGLDYFFNAYSSPLPQLLTAENCSDGCLQNCSCLAAFWHVHTQACFHVEQMGSLKALENQSYIGFLKVNPPPVISSPEQYTPGDAPLGGMYVRNAGAASGVMLSAGAVAGVVLSGLAGLLGLSCFIVQHRRRLHGEKKQIDDDSEEAMLNAIPGLPTRFSYTELHAITQGFSRELGKGGFGGVYAGTLPDGTKVAVKQLEGVRQGDKQFRSEVAIMAGIHHYNLLHLQGFCAQGAHRLLVYEYMENGSLDQWLFKKCNEGTHKGGEMIEERPPLSWDIRCKIALGTARGLAYLHEECRERILHLDIKPQNILLDKEFVAKVADFGLSRLLERDKSVVVTTMRGTPGYLAPEWLKDAGSIDVKCDVFSFGMLLLEVVSGRKNSDHNAKLQEQVYYPEWAYRQLAYSAVHQSGLAIADELTDAKLGSNEDRGQLMNMITTAFLCIVDKPEWRPSMARVVKMLESGEHEDHLDASRVLQQHQQQLLFVLMSNQYCTSFTAPNSHPSINTSSSSSNSSGALLTFTQVSAR